MKPVKGLRPLGTHETGGPAIFDCLPSRVLMLIQSRIAEKCSRESFPTFDSRNVFS